jgi:signal peptidase I
MNSKGHGTKSFIFSLSVIVFITMLLILILKIFIFSILKIPSSSMEPEIKSGEYILVNKLIPGPRLFKNFEFSKSNSKPQTYRIKGVRTIQRNDVLVFNFPYSNRTKLGLDLNVYYVKRCIAIPGDSFYIDNGIYKVKKCHDILGCIENQRLISNAKQTDFPPSVYNCFPKKSSYNWNLKFFGPLYIPRKYDRIIIDTTNIRLYKSLIEYETSYKITVKNKYVFLNNRPIRSYTFQMNYYFMSGDNVYNSRDSRYWGLLPEDHIVGKATMIWKSADPISGDLRWNRILNTIK